MNGTAWLSLLPLWRTGFVLPSTLHLWAFTFLSSSMQSCSSAACLRCLSPAQCFHGPVLTRPPKSLFRFSHSLNSPHVHRGVCLAARPVRQTTRFWCLAKAGKFKTSSLSKASKKTHDFHLLRVTAKKPLASVAAAQVDTFLIFFHVFFVPLWSLSASKPLKTSAFQVPDCLRRNSGMTPA